MSPLIKYYSGGTAQCERLDPLLVFTDREDFMNKLNVVDHVPLYLAIAGSGEFSDTWGFTASSGEGWVLGLLHSIRNFTFNHMHVSKYSL